MENTNANWQDLRPRERMEYLLNSGHLSDCSFMVFDEEGNKIVLKCHKFVLMTASPVFERMFDGDFEESKSPDNIVLDDVSGLDFKKFIEYLYWHDNRRLDGFELSTLQTLIYLSKKFMVSTMTTNCLNVIKRRLAIGLDSDTTVDLYEYAHQIEDIDLIAGVKTHLCNNPTMYIDTAAVYELGSEIFLKFISEFELLVEEKLRFAVIDRYCRIQGLIKAPLKILIKNDDSDTAHLKVKPQSPETMASANIIVPTEETEEFLKDKTDENENDVENDAKEVDNAEQEHKNKREQQKKKEYIKKLVSTIRFTSMNPYDFCRGPGISDLLTVERKYQLLSSICIATEKMRLNRESFLHSGTFE
ncbi:kelch-like protein 40 [Scaptodrosophila lebanonensis]|uniref:Kelch-like protein 40 n=1 Tax=Drosophila lebanonensis TaxID=7225 RepID=A0A6J2TC11_DROLE|nr:kelch-like protein 40 [Scaptodrosophila lebanonensis]